MANLNGGCLCGKIRYNSEAEPLMTALCHCTHCQKQSGSAYTIIVGVPMPEFSVAGDSLAVYQDTGTDTDQPVWRYFCQQCGSPIYTKADVAPSIAFIKAGTLDDTSWLKPQMNIWCSSAQSWIDIDRSLQNAERNPDLG